MYREVGAIIDAERVACNLLSSAPLVFNLFSPMVQELLHASSALNELFPIAIADARTAPTARTASCRRVPIILMRLTKLWLMPVAAMRGARGSFCQSRLRAHKFGERPLRQLSATAAGLGTTRKMQPSCIALPMPRGLVRPCSFDYQSWETDDWELSIAWRICQAIVSNVTAQLPAAAWEIVD
jgi:hypothetical protein